MRTVLFVTFSTQLGDERNLSMVSCDQYRLQIQLHFGNELKVQRSGDFQMHLEKCVNCRNYLGEEGDLSEFLRSSRPLFSASEELHQRVTEEIARQSGLSSATPLSGSRTYSASGKTGRAGGRAFPLELENHRRCGSLCRYRPRDCSNRDLACRGGFACGCCARDTSRLSGG